LGIGRRLPNISGDERAIREGVCKPEFVLPNCDNLVGENGHLVENGSAIGWVWADSLRPGPTVHLYLGQQALSRADSNPF
jgi:hypothetical protein